MQREALWVKVFTAENAERAEIFLTFLPGLSWLTGSAFRGKD